MQLASGVLSRVGLTMFAVAIVSLPGCDDVDSVQHPTAQQVTALRAQFREPTNAPRLGAGSSNRFSDWGLKDMAADALARIGSGALPQLTSALSDPATEVRLYAAKALANMGPEAAPAVPALIRALRDPDPTVRVYAARALGQIGPEAADAVPALMDVLREPGSRTFSGDAAADMAPAS